MIAIFKLIVLVFIGMAFSLNAKAQELPWQPDFTELVPIKPTAEGKRRKTEKRYLKLEKKLLLQQLNYDVDGRVLYALNYRYDSLTKNTRIHDSIAYQYLLKPNTEPDLQKKHFLWQQNKWELLKEEFHVYMKPNIEEFHVYTKDNIFMKMLAPQGDTLQLLKIVRDSNGLPLIGEGFVNIKQPGNNGYYYFNYKGLLNFNAFFYPRRQVIKYKRKLGPRVDGLPHKEEENPQHMYFEGVPGFTTVFQQQYNKQGKLINMVVNHTSDYQSPEPGGGRTTIITLESYFKYKRNGNLAYQLDYIVPHYFGSGLEIGRYSPKVLLFFKITEKTAKNQETEQRFYPIKRTNRVRPTRSYVLNQTLYTANLNKVGYRRIGKPIVILKQYSFY